jgi:hypothetical protein
MDIRMGGRRKNENWANYRVYFYIPNTCEDYDDLREYEKYICAILREQGGMNWGDSCYLSVDY